MRVKRLNWKHVSIVVVVALCLCLLNGVMFYGRHGPSAEIPGKRSLSLLLLILLVLWQLKPLTTCYFQIVRSRVSTATPAIPNRPFVIPASVLSLIASLLTKKHVV